MSRLGYALALAELGYPVLPIRPGSKQPACLGGLHAATTDPDRLAELFDQPGLNLAVVPPKGVLVLDADTAGAAEGLLAAHAELVGAPRVVTPRGGSHFYVRVPVDAGLSVSQRVLPDLDLRGLGRAYALVPPSSAGAGEYRWASELRLPGSLPDASRALLRRLVRPVRLPERRFLGDGPPSTRYAWVALHREARAVAEAPVGSRNMTLNRATFSLGQLAAVGALSAARIERAMLRASEASGLGPTEALATIRSALAAGLASPRQVGARKGGPPRGARASAVPGAPSRAPAQPARGVPHSKRGWSE